MRRPRIHSPRSASMISYSPAAHLKTPIGSAAANRQFDLVLADPPYGEKNVGRRSTSFAQQLLDDSNLPRLIAPSGLFVLGHTKRDTLSFPETWHEIKMLKHGGIKRLAN